MCGIVAAIAQRDVAPILLEGLSRLEYRGYDSSGIGVIAKGRIKCIKTVGKVQALKNAEKLDPCLGTIGIAHTRWATHGKPSVANAHPQLSGPLALVHNGIIENYLELKQKLLTLGFTFKSDTDTEVLAHLIHYCRDQAGSLLKGLQQALQQVEGSYGIALIDAEHPEVLYTARRGAPITIGLGIGENFVASDVLALLPVTRRFIYLEDNEIAAVTRDEVKIYDAKGHEVIHEAKDSDLDDEAACRGRYRHFMQKEIFEQGSAVANTLQGRILDGRLTQDCVIGADEQTFCDIDNVKIVACGTSYHAGLVGRYWLEEFAGVCADVEIASEYRYRRSVVPPKSLFVTLSQSGETADTLAALHLAKQQGYRHTLSICNVPNSSLVRESEFVFMTRAGAEIGVASTKAFTTQLLNLLLLTVMIGLRRKVLSQDKAAHMLKQITALPQLIDKVLSCDGHIRDLAEQFADKEHCLFLGRGAMYPIALEGALKLKEISYIHAEGYAAGELKHGPIALIDAGMPVVVVAPDNALIGKLKSNIQEVRARGGQLYILASDSLEEADKSDPNTHVISIQGSREEILQPILFTIPLQLLAYHVAVIKGTDVDQPRNLAKSVTVE